MKLNQQNNSTSIYLEQIKNEIDLGQGYNRIRPYLFKELYASEDSHNSSDDRLAESLVFKLGQLLNSYVNFHQSEKIHRTLKIIEDLIIHAQEIMTPAMHKEFFISSLINAATPKVITFNSKLDQQSRSKVLGMFLFWQDAYSREERTDYSLFVSAYQLLKKHKLIFPQNPTIKPNHTFKKQTKTQPEKQPQQFNTTTIVLEDISQFTIKTQILQKQNIKQIVNTQYVRLIKHKSKVLYQFSQKSSELTEKQKSLVKDLYKRLRNVLKDIDKYNITKIQSKNSITEQQQYVQQKITPKKKQKEIQSPQKGKKLSSESKPSEKTIQIEPQTLNKQTSSTKSNLSANKMQQQKKIVNLLDIIQQPKPVIIPSNVTSNKERTDNNIDLLGNFQAKPAIKSNQDQQFIEGILVDNTSYQQSATTNKQETMNTVLFEVFSTPTKKLESQDQQGLLAKNTSKNSNSSGPSFQNEKQKDKYCYLPDNINLSPASSNEDDHSQKKQGLSFNLFGIFGSKQIQVKGQNLFDQAKPYDDLPKSMLNKKISETPNLIKPQIEESVTLSQQYKKTTTPIKPVKPVNYGIYGQIGSPSQADEQDKLGPKPVHHNLDEIEIGAPLKQNDKGQLIEDKDQ